MGRRLHSREESPGFEIERALDSAVTVSVVDTDVTPDVVPVTSEAVPAASWVDRVGTSRSNVDEGIEPRGRGPAGQQGTES